MRNSLARTLQSLSSLVFILAIGLVAMAAPLPQEKIKAEEVLAKHLASIGSADALGSIKSIIAVGKCKALSHTNAFREQSGISQLASEGDKVVLAMLFNSTLYTSEKAGYNGQKHTVAILPDGKRSFLGTFLVSHDTPFKQGLIGGVLSTAWPLLNVGKEMPKLTYSGMDKIDNRQVHKLRFDPRKSGGMQITLFFDAETFRHVRTDYQYVLAARMGETMVESIRQLESRYQLVEEFSDFKTEGKLTLPHTYKIRYTIDEQKNTQMLEWMMNFSQFVFDEEIDDKAFSVVSSN